MTTSREEADPHEISRRRWQFDAAVAVALLLLAGWYFYDVSDSGRQGVLTPEIDMITASDAATMLAEGRGLLLDVRAKVIGEVMAAGAVHVPETDLDRLIATLPKDRLLITYCDRAQDAAAIKVASELSKMGYQSVAVLKDGIYGWLIEDLPIQYGE